MTMTVETQARGHVARVTFANPPGNFVSPELLRRIADALDAIDGDDAIRCTVLAASGKAFCAGADLVDAESFAGARAMAVVGDLYSQAERLFRRRKPMIAAVQGAAVGAGLGLAVAADFRVATPAARFASNFVRLAFHPGFALSYTLPRLIGQQHAHWMMLSAERVKPDKALAWGLIDEIAEPETLLDRAHAMAEAVAVNAPLALLAVRATMLAGHADAAAAAMRREHAEQSALKETDDYREGVASVFERREAHFTGR